MDELCDGPLVVNEVAPSPCASGLPDEVLTTDCEGNLALRTVEACKARYDWELACLSDGGTTVPGVAVYDMFDPQNPVVTLYVGGTDVTATHTIVPCPSDDRELVETCFQDITDPSIRYTRVTVVDLSAGAVVVETFWLDATGAVVAAPANVEQCDGADIVECTATVGANTVSEAVDVNLVAAGEVATGGGGTITTFHPALANPALPMVGNTGGGALAAGLNVNVQTAIVGAQFTYTLNVAQDADPGDPADLVVTVWDNNMGTSVTATSIVTTLPYLFDPQGTGLNYPVYGYPNPIVNPYTIVWTGDLPVGDYTVLFLNQNLGITDILTVGIDHNIVAGGTEVTSRAELVALNPCTMEQLISALAPLPVVETSLTSQILNASGPNVVAIGFKSVSVTALSADVTIDTQPIPQGFSWSVDSAENERYSNSVTVNGSSYILTEVR